jgi:hypothetical protein
MIPLTLWYSNDQVDGDVVRTHEELDAGIDRVAALAGQDWPALAEVTQLDDDPAAPMLYLGLHVDKGAIMYPEPTRRVYTAGAPTGTGETMLYMQGTADCEFPASAEVPVQLVRQAAHEFAETGVRPTCVNWQTWNRARSAGRPAAAG